MVEANGGKVLGSVKVPLNTADFSSFLLQAQASKAKIIGLANAGGDTINSIKQAAEFGIVEGGQKLAGLLVFVTDIHSLGLQDGAGAAADRGLLLGPERRDPRLVEAFFDKMNKRADDGRRPASTARCTHYLNAIKATNSVDGPTVVKQMKATPINDFMTKNGQIREDGSLVHDMYLFEVKKPSESKGAWDLLQADRDDPRRPRPSSARTATNARWSRADEPGLRIPSPASRACAEATRLPHCGQREGARRHGAMGRVRVRPRRCSTGSTSRCRRRRCSLRSFWSG